MGSGKSHWGRIWAKELGRTFYDLDVEIEKDLSLSTEEIFQKHGEELFRKKEVFHLHKFGHISNALISCGGGTPCFDDNVGWMKKNGKVIYLKATPQKILGRVLTETAKRPLLKNVNTAELQYFIEKKLEEREPFYRRADHILNVEELNTTSLDFLKK